MMIILATEFLPKNTVSFAIRDDLQIALNVTGSIIKNIRDFGIGITDINGVEQITMTLGLNEIMDLLKGSLLSKTPLTDLILNKRKSDFKVESSISFDKLEEECNAKEDFVNFLFSLLTIPLGGVVNLLGSSNTCFGSINTLYRSLENLRCDEYLKTKDTKSILLKPKLPPMYLSKNQILPLVEQTAPLSHISIRRYTQNWHNSLHVQVKDPLCFVDPKGEGGYVKGPGSFMVADDLTVTPLSMLSSVSVLNELKIPFSDIEEIEVEIGLKEALDILRASLTSTSALTNGLKINPMPRKKIKREH